MGLFLFLVDNPLHVLKVLVVFGYFVEQFPFVVLEGESQVIDDLFVFLDKVLDICLLCGEVATMLGLVFHDDWFLCGLFGLHYDVGWRQRAFGVLFVKKPIMMRLWLVLDIRCGVGCDAILELLHHCGRLLLYRYR